MGRKSAPAESIVEPLRGFLLQLVLVGALVPIVFHAWLWLIAPVHLYAVETLGTLGAMSIVVLITVMFTNAVAVVQTLPVLAGITFAKVQDKRFPTMREVLGTLPLVMLNSLISCVFGAFALHAYPSPVVLQDITADVPSNTTVALQSMTFLCVTELAFYHLHRLFHINKTLYANIHKVHHTWTAPIALASTYAHPIEHILCNLGSVSLGPALFRAHPVTNLAFSMLFAIGAQGHHSGYWHEDVGMHDIHHELFDCNFGNAHLLDHLHGTYRRKTAV